MTHAELRILNAFPMPPGETYGRELALHTGLGSGTVLQALHALERDDLVTSRFEQPEENPGRSPRCMYRLTSHGLRERFVNRDTLHVGSTRTQTTH